MAAEKRILEALQQYEEIIFKSYFSHSICGIYSRIILLRYWDQVLYNGDGTCLAESSKPALPASTDRRACMCVIARMNASTTPPSSKAAVSILFQLDPSS